MTKSINLASTDKIPKSSLDKIMKEVASLAKSEFLEASKNLNKKIEIEINNVKKNLKKK